MTEAMSGAGPVPLDSLPVAGTWGPCELQARQVRTTIDKVTGIPPNGQRSFSPVWGVVLPAAQPLSVNLFIRDVSPRPLYREPGQGPTLCHCHGQRSFSPVWGVLPAALPPFR